MQCLNFHMNLCQKKNSDIGYDIEISILFINRPPIFCHMIFVSFIFLKKCQLFYANKRVIQKVWWKKWWKNPIQSTFHLQSNKINYKCIYLCLCYKYLKIQQFLFVMVKKFPV